MQKTVFQYNKLLYFFDVKLTGFFCCLIICACFYLGIMDMVNIVLLLFIGMIAFYTVWNCFISKSNTEIVRINENSISFYSQGRTDVYDIDCIQKIQIREFPTGGKMYIRINNYGMFKGRYWIHFGKFDEGKKLMRILLNLEYSVHPDSLKSRARRINTRFIELDKARKANL